MFLGERSRSHFDRAVASVRCLVGEVPMLQPMPFPSRTLSGSVARLSFRLLALPHDTRGRHRRQRCGMTYQVGVDAVRATEGDCAPCRPRSFHELNRASCLSYLPCLPTWRKGYDLIHTRQKSEPAFLHTSVYLKTVVLPYQISWNLFLGIVL